MRGLDQLTVAVSDQARERAETRVWATITQVSPLQIQLDGDDDPLPIEPDTLVADLAVNDRVLVEFATNSQGFRGKRAVILGRSGGVPLPEIPQAIPPGVYVPFAGSTAPTGWLLCDGSPVSRTTFAALFAAIGTTYGSGDGSTTFNLPDLRGRVPVGRDSGQSEFNTLGETGGAKTHTLTTSEMPSHTHTGPSHTHTGPSHTHGVGTLSVSSVGDHTHATGHPGWAPGAPTKTNIDFGSGEWGADQPTFGAGGHNHNLSGSTASGGTGNTGSGGTGNTGSAGSGNAHNNLQPYLVANYIIKT